MFTSVYEQPFVQA